MHGSDSGVFTIWPRAGMGNILPSLPNCVLFLANRAGSGSPVTASVIQLESGGRVLRYGSR